MTIDEINNLIKRVARRSHIPNDGHQSSSVEKMSNWANKVINQILLLKHDKRKEIDQQISQCPYGFDMEAWLSISKKLKDKQRLFNFLCKLENNNPFIEAEILKRIWKCDDDIQAYKKILDMMGATRKSEQETDETN